MSFRRRLVVFGYPALELITLGALVTWIGLGWVLVILALGVLVGLVVMRIAGRQAFAVMREASQTGTLPDGRAGMHALAFAGGFLIAIPGIWSKVIGLLMQLPPVQATIGSRFAGRFTVFGTGMHGDIVQGTVVTVHNDEGPAEAGPSRAITDR